MRHDEAPDERQAVRPTAEGLLPEVYARLSRHGQPTLPRLWDALSARFAQEWAAYCRARDVDEMPEWEDFPLTRPADLTRLLQDLLGPPDTAPTAPGADEASVARSPRRTSGAPPGVPAAQAGRPDAPPSASGPARATRPPAGPRQPMTPLPFAEQAPTAPRDGPAAQEPGAPPGTHSPTPRRRRRQNAASGAVRQLSLFDEPQS